MKKTLAKEDSEPSPENQKPEVETPAEVKTDMWEQRIDERLWLRDFADRYVN